MDVIIIEDEVLAAERLAILLKNYDPEINIVACIESVEDAVKWLQTRKHPDLFFVDIHLSDGFSFEIFRQAATSKPIIFTTAYENYALEAFRLFSLDYILKPVTGESLAAALNKYKSIAHQLLNPVNYDALIDNLKENLEVSYKRRFLGKLGARLFFITEDEVSYFLADNKILYLVDRRANRYIINGSLEKMLCQLDPAKFFRINRRAIVHIDCIEQLKIFSSSKLKLILKGVADSNDLQVSRERLADFKVWAEGGLPV
ncbi:MAG: response regulator transcription factor [Chitinophagaceae bacterium]|nr:MAG: response regulator transcription factor [Chitinophagaceae bacterium]